MPETCDILVVGGGIAGVSLAARLAPHARVALAEAEEHLGTQTTGRSAALLVEAYEKPEIRRLTTRSRAFFETPPKGFSEAPLSGRRGVMVYGGADDVPKLREEFELAGRTTTVRWCDADAVAERCPLLKPGVAAAGFLEPNALQLDANALLQGFARVARANGAAFHTAAPARGISRRFDGWEVQAGARAIFCAILVNAAGAWGDEVAALAGVARRGLRPMRRTAATLPVPEDDREDAAHAIPLRHRSTAASISSRRPARSWSASPRRRRRSPVTPTPTSLTWPWRSSASTRRPSCRGRDRVATWAGLRTFAADRLPVVGFDAEAEGFFWYAGQGGTGIQTSPAHSALAAKLILRQELDAAEREIAAAFRCDRSLPAWP